MSLQHDTVSRAVERLANASTAPEVINSPTPALENDEAGNSSAIVFVETSAKLLNAYARFSPHDGGIPGDGDLFARGGFKQQGRRP